MARPPKHNKSTDKETSGNNTTTPMMQQYQQFKIQYPDAILLFRVGDFYETFGDDAVTAAKVLGITLTKRHNGAASETALAGFPHHALDTYLPKLVRAGYRVAVCDQLEDPKLAKKIVKRGITELVTPGTALGDKMLDHATNNYLAAVHFADSNIVGVAFTDASTGEFFATQGTPDYVEKLLQGLQPAEVLYAKSKQQLFVQTFGSPIYTYPLEDWIFTFTFAQEVLLRHFKTQSLKGFGLDDWQHAQTAAGTIIHYLGLTQHHNLQHLTALARLEQDRYVWLDRFTIRNLELLHPTAEDGTPLLHILDKTVSPAGARLLKKWLLLPLKDVAAIEQRQQIVAFFLENAELANALSEQIRLIGDLERLIAKAPLGRIMPRQVVQLRRSLLAIAQIKQYCAESESEPLHKIADQLNPCTYICDKIGTHLLDDAPLAVNKGGIIAEGISAELDELRKLQSSGKSYLVQLQEAEIKKTGISSLKIGFNNVFGYYLEVRNRYKDQVPESWIRKQTLTDAERYITEELKIYEEKIMGAEEKILILETALFEQIVAELNDYIKPIQHNAQACARLDVLLSFAVVARQYQYCRPNINQGYALDIRAGRHPVIERQMQLGEPYVPNDMYVDIERQQILLITGPNMAGKSAFLRQTALIVLMAQMGSFVPATEAHLGLVDKVFTRVGASDNLSSGESTFMVEMTETASIMNNISERSLILLDEIGRGTSTYDGISIAWALAEYLHENPKARAKTLFATHYHELTELADRFERVKNYTVAVKEMGNRVIFLRRLLPGSAERSFGIHVAEMAGMPKPIVERANEVLKVLEQKSHAPDAANTKQQLKQLPTQQTTYQMSFFDMDSPELARLKEVLDKIDVNVLTPVEALLKLHELKQIADKKSN